MGMPRIRTAVRRVVPLVAAALGCSLTTATGPVPAGLNVLFVGNSLTYTNDLPGMVEALLDSAAVGPRTIDAVAFPDFGLADHWVRGEAQQQIARGGWDVVAIQQGPSATEGRPSLIEYAQRYGEKSRRVGARVALYMVWPSQSRPFDFDGVSESYAMAADSAGGLLFPVGEAWRAAWRRDSTLALYGPDGFHPSRMATYLAALVMFEQLTGRPPVGLPGSLSVRGSATPVVALDPVISRLLQDAAAEANATFARP